ncbi:LysR family transcriptional regulator [Lentzea albida]|uniref:LysR family transcriptional regulator, hydrogen peroxide-inducible genes activator n=1 Tax=Lentzea albida TaxID=65499 RepID=A0A1H9WT69_9PSEU|nr:LysR family transcriptional regulator [Lentzea albida]SES37065.1 LysR family transcriptional regulator, hydrogen peroxide-inducible genes activator [Lentzea albida]
MTALQVAHEAGSGAVPAWDDLRAFLAVARTGNFTRAAEELHTSQPTVTRQVQRLERQLGTALFGRTRREVWLTAEGRTLLKWVARMEDNALRGIAACTRPLPAEVHIASYSYSVGHLMEELEAEDSQVEWHVATLPPEPALHQLARDEVHAALCYTTTSSQRAEIASSSQGLAVQDLVQEPVWLALPLGHRLATRASITPADLVREKWISAGRGPLHEMLAEMCSAAGFVPDVRHVAEDPSTVGALLSHGKALSLSSPTIDTRGEFLLKPLENGPTRRIFLAWKPERLRPEATSVVLAAARRWYRRRAATNPDYLALLNSQLGEALEADHRERR